MLSLLGGILPQQITAYRAATLEDSVIFVHDVEKRPDRLDGFEKKRSMRGANYS